jgi:hypothetical protein
VASTFTLTLDTTAPAGVALNINSGAAFTGAQAVTAQPGTSDGVTTGYQMKLWGSVDPAANANIQATEGASSWIAYSTSQAVTLSTGDALKTLNLRIRDDVGNESSPAVKTITLDTTVPVISISVAASPTKVSKIATFETTTFQFQSDTPLTAWKVKVVPAAGSLENAGTAIPTTAGSTNVTGGALGATTNQSVTIKGADLETASAGDGAKIVKVFGQEASGSWSV